ncbi:MAG: hypothetical protein NZ959_12165 [Armatimonadetes bacterium]|nr:hypothetical protein [Armatimonadota bacterium]MDW8123017.1 hypothetical protein [Armatimonadota bacterium]
MTVSFQEPDRVPLYVWIFNQPAVIDQILNKYGTFETFCDALDLDLTQAFPDKGPLKERPAPGQPGARMDPAYGWVDSLEDALQVPFNAPDDLSIYQPIIAEINHHKD